MKYRLLVLLVLIAVLAGAYSLIKRNAPQTSQPAVHSDNTSASNTSVSTGKPAENLNPPAPVLTPKTLEFASGKKITLNVAANYAISVAAQGFKHVRFMAWSPDQRLFIGEMTDAGDTSTGRVLVLDNFNQASGFGSAHVYLDHLRNPNSVAFYTDKNGAEWIYIALTDKLIRYKYTPGDNAPASQPQLIAAFPASGQSAAKGGWHLTRTIAIDRAADIFYVSVGSSCNSCEETETDRGVILQMNPDGSNNHVFAAGLRNAVGIIFAGGNLYATANEADHLGPDRPNDLVYKIASGANYGWPYCYQYNSQILADTTTKWQHPLDCAKAPLAWAVLPPHSAPLGLEYFDNNFADPAVRDSLLVAMHGSGKPGIGTGYAVSIVREGSAPATLISGFLQNGNRVGRPVDIIAAGPSSFFVTDDLNGAVYYLRYHLQK